VGIAKVVDALNAVNLRAGANVGFTGIAAAKFIFTFSSAVTMGASTRKFKLPENAVPVASGFPTPTYPPIDPTAPPTYPPIDPTAPPTYPPFDPTNPPTLRSRTIHRNPPRTHQPTLTTRSHNAI
jgi:hypothetical protein